MILLNLSNSFCHFLAFLKYPSTLGLILFIRDVGRFFIIRVLAPDVPDQRPGPLIFERQPERHRRVPFSWCVVSLSSLSASASTRQHKRSWHQNASSAP